MKKYLFYLVFLVAGVVPATAGTVTYTPDDVTIFRNPERGFTEELGGETMLTDSKNHVVLAEADWFFDETDSHYADRQSQTLVMLMYYLGNYRTGDLSAAILQGFDEDMQKLRDEGFKCVLRFAYDWNSNNDADLTHVKRHIQQLTPHLAANKDVIYVLETGFVGQWGEWYYSSHFGNETQHMNNNRLQVLQAMLAACPPDRFLLTRYPLIKIGCTGDEVPLGSAEAFTGTDRARLGHHNDAFLNKYGNDGTYGRDGDGPDDDPVLRNYISQETLYVPNGGETNVEKSSLANTVAQYDTTMAELRRFHWSFCGSTYSEKVTNKWRANGAFAEMDRKLGYRYQLVNADLPETVTAGSPASFRLTIRNTGFAPLYNERKVYIVLRAQTAGQTTYRMQMNTDPRRWLPNGVETQIDEQLTIPSDMPSGTYDLYLYLPDASASIAGDPRYAVRFANAGVWDAASGMNSLGASVAVNGGTQRVGDVQGDKVQSTKVLRDGRLFIIRDGQQYDMLGSKQQ